MTLEEYYKIAITKEQKTVTDLLCDSYKWKKLSRHTENREAKEKYDHISTMLYDMFMNEYNSMIAKYKED